MEDIKQSGPDLFCQQHEFPSGLPLFEMTSSVMRETSAMSSTDTDQMLEDMRTTDVLQMPYERIAIKFCLSDVIPDAAQKAIMFATPRGNEISLHSVEYPIGHHRKLAIINRGLWALDYKLPLDWKEFRYHCWWVFTLLLIALATRNVVKTEERNTRFHNNHKKSKKQFHGPTGTIFISRTTIEAPLPEDRDNEHESGGIKRPHLRRGHAHTVCYGIRRSERRVEWRPAVFVNGDPKYTPATQRYRI
jgi:hypothetical protein